MNQASNANKTPAINTRMVTFFHAVMFVLGFSMVFIVGWGGAATLIGQVFGYYKIWLGRIGGVVIVIFGLSSLGLIRLPWMYYADTRHQWTPGRGGGILSSVMMGVFFCSRMDSLYWHYACGDSHLELDRKYNRTGNAADQRVCPGIGDPLSPHRFRDGTSNSILTPFSALHSYV